MSRAERKAARQLAEYDRHVALMPPAQRERFLSSPRWLHRRAQRESVMLHRAGKVRGAVQVKPAGFKLAARFLEIAVSPWRQKTRAKVNP